MTPPLVAIRLLPSEEGVALRHRIIAAEVAELGRRGVPVHRCLDAVDFRDPAVIAVGAIVLDPPSLGGSP